MIEAQATKDFTVKTVQKAADIAVHAGSRLYTDSASSYQALKGYLHEFVNHTKKEYARGDVHENRAECLFSLLKPYLRVFRGLSKMNLPGYLGFFQFLRNFRHQTAFEQAEMILCAALDPAIASTFWSSTNCDKLSAVGLSAAVVYTTVWWGGNSFGSRRHWQPPRST